MNGKKSPVITVSTQPIRVKIKASRQEDENDNVRAICPGEGEIDRRTGDEKCLCPRGERNKSQQSQKVEKYAIITSGILGNCRN